MADFLYLRRTQKAIQLSRGSSSAVLFCQRLMIIYGGFILSQYRLAHRGSALAPCGWVTQGHHYRYGNRQDYRFRASQRPNSRPIGHY